MEYQDQADQEEDVDEEDEDDEVGVKALKTKMTTENQSVMPDLKAIINKFKK